MSYILDALKKSDLERQQRAGPNLALAQHQQFFVNRDGRRWWIVFLAVALLITGGAVSAYLAGYLRINLSGSSSSPGVQETDPSGSELASLSATQALSGTVVDKVGAAAVTPGEAYPPQGQPYRASGEGWDVPPPVASIPELWSLPLSIRTAIPSLDFSLHVYSKQSEQRSIIINNRMMREGEAINPDLTLYAITEKGVIMRFRHEYFRVGVLEDW